MRKQYWNMMRTATVAVSVLVAGRATAGSLNPTNAPGPTMHTLEDIYQKVQNLAPQTLQTISATTIVVNAGYYASTNLALVDADLVAANIITNVTIFGIAGTLPTNAGVISYAAALPKTGQTNSYAAGDDGAKLKGMSWPNARFADNSNGTVTDNLTGLIWLKNANGFGKRTWAQALADCETLNTGEKGLSDGSVEGDWRLPNVNELGSLIDCSQFDPALFAGHPFSAVQSAFYWSSTTYPNTAENWAFGVFLSAGVSGLGGKTDIWFVWPVRGGE